MLPLRAAISDAITDRWRPIATTFKVGFPAGVGRSVVQPRLAGHGPALSGWLPSGSYRIATAPEANSRRLTSLRVDAFHFCKTERLSKNESVRKRQRK